MRYIQQEYLPIRKTGKIPPCSTLRSCRTKHADDCRCHNRIRQRHPLSFFFTLPTPHHEARYYSGYISVNTYDKRLPALKQPPLVRENRLYQADWLLRFYQFKVEEIVDDSYPDLDLEIDPKLGWALRHPELFPIDINQADYEMILRVPGIGIKSARQIIASRRFSKLGFYELKKIGVVMKKAQYFITCNELPTRTVNELTPTGVRRLLVPKPKKKVDERQLILNFTDNE